MLKFAWRWADVGDHVLCHDRDDLNRDLRPGVVAVVKRDRGDTQIGIKITDEGDTEWLWPTPLFVHPDPLDPEETCWICDQNQTRSEPRAAAG